MLKVRYGPADDDIVEQVIDKMPPHVREDVERRLIVTETILCLGVLGYDITKEIEITGDMEQALRSLNQPGSYTHRLRPVRHAQP